MSNVGLCRRVWRFLRPDDELPLKVDPARFGGGKRRGIYTRGELADRLCSRAGCGRRAHATWAGCADSNVLRPLCAECDIELNRLAQQWWGDPAWEQVIVRYANEVADEVDRSLDVPWLYRAGDPDDPDIGR